METAMIAPLAYSLEDSCPVPWAATAEAQLHRDYPFLNQDATDQNFVIRRYLETLWLPESLNPLAYLISSLRRVASNYDKNASLPHPLHSLLDPVLLSSRTASDKYRIELVQILVEGGGAGEQEEMMMWYAWEHEKSEHEEEGKVDEDKWRKSWLERLERREAMIQILLIMLKLSLPGARPDQARESPKKKRKKNKEAAPPESTEQLLESYMDKLAVWCLTASLDSAHPTSQASGSNQGQRKVERHWTQKFFEDIVEPLFKTSLHEQCELFRSKLYPEPALSDADDSDIETLVDGRNSRVGSRAPSVSRALSSRATSVAASSKSSMQRSRSRSLSVSLAQDEATQRANLVGPKRGLSREVSMSRIFKERTKVQAQSKIKVPMADESKQTKAKLKRDIGVTLIKETPVKRSRLDTSNPDEHEQLRFVMAAKSVPSPPPTSSSDPADVYIEDTPVASRRCDDKLEKGSSLSPLSPMLIDRLDARQVVHDPAAQSLRDVKDIGPFTTRSRTQENVPSHQEALDENADESYMDSFSSSNVMSFGKMEDESNKGLSSQSVGVRKAGGLLGGPRQMTLLMDDGRDIEMDTPTKRKIRKR
ncbi:uncharacterized protein FOMMEDRAFT_170406 [Fomitiporia mediterranea MF3/22]|uniref:uncharacterized protein n=1 Tax=Fomitiporia mediterranea (strain MF3/22) TaxID=694068 RepID=UPI0004409500|nr:uncharacterized protein FOMMEDRAFT_170406 [Fomitiporia mediterranea MF3/22]EJC99917.1 hypothetical protein FOMMEDRAFT_170406 [Fomitiporia mediterranea MF3/22]